MNFTISEYGGSKFYKADTNDRFIDLSVNRAANIVTEVTRICTRSYAFEKRGRGFEDEWIAKVVDVCSDLPAFTKRGIRIRRELVILAVAGLLIEKEWKQNPRTFPDDSIHAEEVRDFVLRKIARFRRTEHVLVDVTPYHPLQTVSKRERHGAIEQGSPRWKVEYAKAFEGYSPRGSFEEAYDYAEEFDLNIDFADEIDFGRLAS